MPDMSVWTGRADPVRWHHRVQPVTHNCHSGVALIGFACDEGVRRNGGRVGARDGPRAIRAALANLAWHQTRPVYDTDDVACDDGNMEAAQDRLAAAVASMIAAGHRPLVIGGGHETAWGTFKGIKRALPRAAIGVINIDAHFDLRGDKPGNSGTPFAQMSRWCAANGQPFRYFALGVARPSNTAELFDTADALGVQYKLDSDLVPWRLEAAFESIEAFAAPCDAIHLSIDLDVLPASVMPAVSAPAARGVSLDVVEALIEKILSLGKTVAVDVVEFNPAFDPDGRGARVAAQVAWLVAKHFTRP